MKPPLGALANAGHPLSRGLVGAWLFNEGGGLTVYDSSPPVPRPNGIDVDRPSAHGSLVRTSPSAWQGTGVLTDGVDDVINLTTSAKLKPRRQLSLVIRFWALNPAGGLQQVYRAAGHIGAGSTWAFGFWYASSVMSCGVTSGATDYQLNSPTPIDKAPHTWGMTWTTETTMLRMYRDGAEVSSRFTGAPGFTLSYNGQETLVADGNLAALWIPCRALWEHVFVYDRELRASEMMQLAVDPYAMYRPRRPLMASTSSPFYFQRYVLRHA